MPAATFIPMLVLLALLGGRDAMGQAPDKLPPELEGVGLTEKLGEPLPLDLSFTDENGKPVTLRDYFSSGKPVILNLGYFGCPMLCGLVMNGMTDAMRDLSLTPGTDYTVLSISFDPSETHTLARVKKQNYIRELGKPEAARGWHFLTGSEGNIKAVTDAAGFGFKWIEARREFAHPATIIVLTPDGKLSRYLYGTTFPAQTLRLSLVEAAEGKIGTTLDQFLLFCFQYDSDQHRYAIAAMNFMRLGGFITMVAIGSWIFVALRRERRRIKAESGIEGAAAVG